MIQLDYKDRRPLYEQVSEKIRELILSGVLGADQKIPSVRSMAMELSVTPNTIQRAYSELEKTGYLYTISGRGNFVSSAKELKRLKDETTLTNVNTAIWDARKHGVSKETLLDIIEVIYGGADDDTD